MKKNLELEGAQTPPQLEEDTLSPYLTPYTLGDLTSLNPNRPCT